MTENAWWIAVLAVPGVYGTLASLRFVGFHRQPHLVLSRTQDRWTTQLRRAGGASAVRTGILVDAGFAPILCTAAALVVAAANGPWWIALPALALDLVEGVVLWRAVSRTPLPTQGVRFVFAVGTAKFAAYAVLLVILLLAVWELCCGGGTVLG